MVLHGLAWVRAPTSHPGAILLTWKSIRVVGAFQALLVARRTLLASRVDGMLLQPLALLWVHGTH